MVKRSTLPCRIEVAAAVICRSARPSACLPAPRVAPNRINFDIGGGGWLGTRRRRCVDGKCAPLGDVAR